MLALCLVLARSAAPPAQAQLRADLASAVVEPSGDLSLRTSVLETAATAEAGEQWIDPATTADPNTYTRWILTYEGCLVNTPMDGVVRKKKVKDPTFDGYSCRHYCGSISQDGDRIGLGGMTECYCLPADWVPHDNSSELSAGELKIDSPDDWVKLKSGRDNCQACATQTPSGCMKESTRLPCESGGAHTCETCHKEKIEDNPTSYSEYCDTGCRAEGALKCGSPSSKDLYGEEIPNHVAIYRLSSEVMTAVAPVVTPVGCQLNTLACGDPTPPPSPTTTTTTTTTKTTHWLADYDANLHDWIPTGEETTTAEPAVVVPESTPDEETTPESTPDEETPDPDEVPEVDDTDHSTTPPEQASEAEGDEGDETEPEEGSEEDDGAEPEEGSDDDDAGNAPEGPPEGNAPEGPNPPPPLQQQQQ